MPISLDQYRTFAHQSNRDGIVALNAAGDSIETLNTGYLANRLNIGRVQTTPDQNRAVRDSLLNAMMNNDPNVSSDSPVMREIRTMLEAQPDRPLSARTMTLAVAKYDEYKAEMERTREAARNVFSGHTLTETYVRLQSADIAQLREERLNWESHGTATERARMLTRNIQEELNSTMVSETLTRAYSLTFGIGLDRPAQEKLDALVNSRLTDLKDLATRLMMQRPVAQYTPAIRAEIYRTAVSRLLGGVQRFDNGSFPTPAGVSPLLDTVRDMLNNIGADSGAAMVPTRQSADFHYCMAGLQATLSRLPPHQEATFSIPIDDIIVQVHTDADGNLTACAELTDNRDALTPGMKPLALSAEGLSHRIVADMADHPERYPKGALLSTIEHDFTSARSSLRREVYETVLNRTFGIASSEVGNVSNLMLRNLALVALQTPNAFAGKADVLNFIDGEMAHGRALQEVCRINDEQASALVARLDSAMASDAGHVNAVADISVLRPAPAPAAEAPAAEAPVTGAPAGGAPVGGAPAAGASGASGASGTGRVTAAGAPPEEAVGDQDTLFTSLQNNARRVHDEEPAMRELMSDLILNRDADVYDRNADNPAARIRETLLAKPEATLQILNGTSVFYVVDFPGVGGDILSAFDDIRQDWSAYKTAHPGENDRELLDSFLGMDDPEAEERLTQLDGQLELAVNIASTNVGVRAKESLSRAQAETRPSAAPIPEIDRAIDCGQIRSAGSPVPPEEQPMQLLRGFLSEHIPELCNDYCLNHTQHRPETPKFLTDYSTALRVIIRANRNDPASVHHVTDQRRMFVRPTEAEMATAISQLSAERFTSEVQALGPRRAGSSLSVAAARYRQTEMRHLNDLQERLYTRNLRALTVLLEQGTPDSRRALLNDPNVRAWLSDARAARGIDEADYFAPSAHGGTQHVIQRNPRPPVTCATDILRRQLQEAEGLSDSDTPEVRTRKMQRAEAKLLKLTGELQHATGGTLRAVTAVVLSEDEAVRGAFAEGGDPVEILKDHPRSDAAKSLKKPCSLEYDMRGKALRHETQLQQNYRDNQAARTFWPTEIQNMMADSASTDAGYGKLVTDVLMHYFDADVSWDTDTAVYHCIAEEAARENDTDEALRSEPEAIAGRLRTAVRAALGDALAPNAPLPKDVEDKILAGAAAIYDSPADALEQSRQAEQDSREQADIVRADDEATLAALGPDEAGNVMTRKDLARMRTIDRRAMVAAAIRYAPPTVDDGMNVHLQTEGDVLCAALKGAGPIMQKALQGMDASSMGDMFAQTIRDMKSSLAPIEPKYVQAQLLDIVERSHGSITGITIRRSLGAASVGQAFLCNVTKADGTEQQCVLKLLRPDVRTKALRERRLFERYAAAIPGMKETFRGQLERIMAELDLTAEADNARVGRLYADGTPAAEGEPSLDSMQLLEGVEPTADAMLLKVAPGRDLSKCMESNRSVIDALNRANSIAAPTPENVLPIGELRQYMQQFREMRLSYLGMLRLSARWVQEGIFDSGFYHGDLHAGNIMNDHGRLTVIDYGNATQLTKNQQNQVMLAMAGATYKRSDWFIEGYLSLLPPEEAEKFREMDQVRTDSAGCLLNSEGERVFDKNTDQPIRVSRDGFMIVTDSNGAEHVSKKKALGPLSGMIDALLQMGGWDQTAYRIAVPLARLQQAGIACPAAIFNFSTCQIRLQHAADDLHAQLREMTVAVSRAIDNAVEAAGTPLPQELKELQQEKDVLLDNWTGSLSDRSFVTTVGGTLMHNARAFMHAVGGQRGMDILRYTVFGLD